MGQENPTQRPRRLSDAVYATVIAPGIAIRGDLSGQDAVDLGGPLEGDAVVDGDLKVRKGARLGGAIQAEGLVIEGRVDAPAIVAERIEVGAEARVKGQLRARVIAIAEGAVFDGSVEMQGEGAADGPTFFKEQRQGR